MKAEEVVEKSGAIDQKRNNKAEEKSQTKVNKHCNKQYDHWSKEEQNRLVNGLRLHGKNFQALTKYVGTRQYAGVQYQCEMLLRNLKNKPGNLSTKFNSDSDLLKILEGPTQLAISKWLPDDH